MDEAKVGLRLRQRPMEVRRDILELVSDELASRLGRLYRDLRLPAQFCVHFKVELGQILRCQSCIDWSRQIWLLVHEVH